MHFKRFLSGWEHRKFGQMLIVLRIRFSTRHRSFLRLKLEAKFVPSTTDRISPANHSSSCAFPGTLYGNSTSICLLTTPASKIGADTGCRSCTESPTPFASRCALLA
eukprot:5692795-Pleurochrysis_carterae.AAC.2